MLPNRDHASRAVPGSLTRRLGSRYSGLGRGSRCHRAPSRLEPSWHGSGAVRRGASAPPMMGEATQAISMTYRTAHGLATNDRRRVWLNVLILLACWSPARLLVTVAQRCDFWCFWAFLGCFLVFLGCFSRFSRSGARHRQRRFPSSKNARNPAGTAPRCRKRRSTILAPSQTMPRASQEAALAV